MKLVELTGVKHLSQYYLSDLIEYFIGHTGYSYKGEGASGTVFRHPTKPEIIKFWAIDDAYDTFIEYLQTHHDEHLVKVLQQPKTLTMFHTRPIKDQDGDELPSKFKYVRLELLTPLKPGQPVYGIDLHKLIKQMYDAFAEQPSSVFFKARLDKIIAYAHKVAVGNVDEDGLRKFFQVYIDMFNEFGHEFNYDLSVGNIMLRGTTPVIIDPFSDSYSMSVMNNFNYFSQRDHVEQALEFASGHNSGSRRAS